MKGGTVNRRGAMAAGTAVLGAMAADAAQAQGPAPAYAVPGLRLAFTAWVTISGLQTIGAIPGGQGRVAPITGGTFEGPRLKGTVMPGGADWQTVRPDGVTELRAHYGLKTDDGAIIQVLNTVLIRPAAGDVPRLARSTISLTAPAGPHDWLNKAVFAGTINDPADPRAPVTIRCFELI